MAGSGIASESQARPPVVVTNRDGAGPFVFVCEHASNWLPAGFGALGLSAPDMTRHIAWDPGALPVAQRLSRMLDSPLVESCVSRLAIDCNRPLDAPDLIPAMSETTVIPGNVSLSEAERAARIELSYRPFHDALGRLINERLGAGLPVWIVTIHSYTPVYRGVSRPWHVGVIHDGDDRLAGPMLEQLKSIVGVVSEANEPYSPADRVYHTLERHARPRGLPCAMIEIRNDEIADEAGQSLWAERLAAILGSDEMKAAARSPLRETAQKVAAG